MPSTTSPPRRRQRADIESDEEAENLRASQRSTPSTSSGKRARTDDYQSDEESVAPAVRSANGFRNDDDNLSDDEESGEGNSNTFQPGALIRVKLTNFVTYESAEFFPGPNLNMVIGPNGTGKSSLVCAICLGLGWGPQHLGRASQIGEFVKHGLSEAYIEIELQKKEEEPFNHVVRVRIIRDGNSREWFLDGKKTSLKAIQALTVSYSIQVDNLCQFLPQDKVSEFAGLSPVELLLQTQRAAAPEEMLQMHEALKKYRKDQKVLDRQNISDKEELETLETRQQSLHAEVVKLQERQEVLLRVKILEHTRPFVEYQLALAEHRVFKENKRLAQKRYEELKTTVEPTMQSIEQKKEYASRIDLAIKDRKAALTEAEQAADKKTRDIGGLDEEITKNEQEVNAVYKQKEGKKRELDRIKRKILELKAGLNGEPVVFDGREWNERIREKEHELRDVKAEVASTLSSHDELKDRARVLRNRKDEAQRDLAAFDTQEGQQMNNLEKKSAQTAKAWKWVQEHLEEFEKEVYAPPMISCAIKDPRYAAAVESMLQRNDFLAITAQTTNDAKILSDQLHGTEKFTDVTIRTANDDLASLRQRAPLSPQEMRNIGMEGWAIDFIDGPEVVLCMLCNSQKLHLAAVTLNDITEPQYNLIVTGDKLIKWTTATQSYKVSKRQEYGPSAVSTITRALYPASYWVDQPIDTSARGEIEVKMKTAHEEMAALKTQNETFKSELVDLRTKEKDLEEKIRALKSEKEGLQRAYGAWKALPEKIRVEEDSLQARQNASAELTKQIKKLQNQHDLAVVRKSKYALEYKTLVEKIRDCHDELLEAQIRLIEARSDVEALTARNEDIVRQLEEEEARKKHAEQESKRVQDIAKRALAICKDILADEENAPYEQEFTHPPADMTLESLDIEIAAEQSKLEYMQLNNPNALRQYESRQVEVDKLKEKVTATETKLEKLEQHINKIRGKWEPQLDALIAEISDAFSFNFEQIGCAGSVSVHKDDDFDLWAIQIKVKFRKNEDLQILDAHRQSGGERSVSTIFFLLSLQRLARAPFRVVDEINQGMDPRNERMVHERMVEIACNEHTSQYFLITPKLLTGLRYDKRMKVLCIASGEYMPDKYQKLDVSKIIDIRKTIMTRAIMARA
ncbi:P-loop containing nucleoside triphosphate hydrolase protein [Mollisia scopiformis]|uniref:Structural maintenance of chromosomes protein 5 n=1 Tax=Mollisia scopiformis TaxID=149040 RepID=A0A194XTZ6_MOLSC|nr:P-loop containing nucleoside triphosphate hydrolase protein [Mollisia scopiformis]KUJ23509.1 P-loop containing nucleoside triphosphate hydrolase protein [Mollisia scopiformis]